MKICFIDNVVQPDKPGRSGMSDTIWGMTKVLIDQGHQVHIVGTYGEGPLKSSQIKLYKCRASRLVYRNVLGKAIFTLEAHHIINRIAPDLVHMRDYLVSALLLIQGCRYPVVLTTPGNIFSRIKRGHSYDWTAVRALRWGAQISARRSSVIIATSNGMRQAWLDTGVPADRMVMIPLGVDTERFYHVHDARMKLKLPKDGPIMLYVGRYSVEKGLGELLEAIELIRDFLRKRQAQIVLIGRGPLQAALKERIEKSRLSDLLTLHDYVHQDELKTWYSAADLLLMPSWNEPFGKVFVEAMACSTPSIATRAEGPEDHILHGYNGYLIRPQDSQALASQIQQVLALPESLSSMRAACVNYVKDNLTWEAVTKSIVTTVYEPLIAQRPIGQPVILH